MRTVRIVAILLIAAGVLGIVYGRFSYTKERHTARLGAIEMSVNEKQTINIPVWAGVGAIAAGALLLIVRR
jgi:hypothetical protein